jgi:hypothetical protein
MAFINPQPPLLDDPIPPSEPERPDVPKEEPPDHDAPDLIPPIPTPPVQSSGAILPTMLG